MCHSANPCNDPPPWPQGQRFAPDIGFCDYGRNIRVMPMRRVPSRGASLSHSGRKAMRFIWRIILGRPRLIIALLCGLLSTQLWSVGSSLTRSILSWDTGCTIFLVLVAHMFSTERESRLARDAARDQEGEWTMFWLTVGAVAASFAAIIGEFSVSKNTPEPQRGLHVAL